MTIKKEKAIIFIVNKSYLFALSTMLLNIRYISPNSYNDIVVYSDGLSHAEQNELLKIEPNIKFINYSLADWISDHKEITSSQAQNFLQKYSHLAWSKYKIFEQLEFYHKVLFLDLDMLVKKNFSSIFDSDIIFAWRSGQNFHGKFGSKKNLLGKIAEIPTSYPSPNGGLLYATDSINFRKFCKDARDFTVQFLDYFASGLDELAISWSTFKNNISITELNESEYNTLPAQYSHMTKILHFMGEEKLWNNELLQAIFPEWIQFYKENIAITNFSSNKVKLYESLGTTIRKQLNEIRWFNILKNPNLCIPDYLRLSFNFNNEWLILNYNENKSIYYEFKFSQFQSGYLIGLWIRDKFYLGDKNILDSIEHIVQGSPYINKIIDNRGIYIYTNKVDDSEVSGLLNYFLRVTKPLLIM